MASDSPLRMTLGNLETGESITAQYNPTRVGIGVDAHFGQTKTPGATSEEMQFSHVGNVKPTFTLTFKARAPGAPDLLDIEAFLLSLIYPPQVVGGVTSGAPPLVLFSWPNWIMLVTRKPKFSQETTLWNKNGRPEEQTYKVELESQSTRRIGREAIRRSAFRRLQ